MVVDCHVHISARAMPAGMMSDRLVGSLAFRFMSWRLGVSSKDPQADQVLERKLAQTIDETPELDAAVVLAFDAVHDDQGRPAMDRTHLYVSNDYVIALAARYPKMLFGASIHPYRSDAVAEIERCVKAGAVLLKWLPIVQGFNPADPRCFPVYEALAHFGLPLLSHTGGEQALPIVDMAAADPILLVPAIQRGVTVIAAHCGSRSRPFETDYVPTFVRLAKEHEKFYGDTAALDLPNRSYTWKTVLEDDVVRDKLVHGSDWPIPAFPSPIRSGVIQSLGFMREKNWLRRDVLLKQSLGLDDNYWRRAGSLLRKPQLPPA